jgi:hypothetical protein
MPENNRIAIVILNWNGEDLLEKFLPSVVRNSDFDNVDVFVADNNSTDNSINFLQTNFPTVKIIRLSRNYGFAKGYNKALEQVDADYFVLLNSDVEVSPGWIKKCMQLFEKNDKIVAVQPKILSYEKPHLFEYAGAAGGFIDKFCYPFCRGRILNEMEPDIGQYNKATPVFWASGACMFIKGRVFKNAGGFDEDFWAHMEEIDLCWRLKNMGYEIWYQPESVVFHLGGGTLSYGSSKKIYLNFRNSLYMISKNLPHKKAKRTFFTRLILDGIAAFKFLFGFHFKGFIAVFHAHISFYKRLTHMRAKRELAKFQISGDKHPEIYPKSLMWKFFIQKKHKFSDLDFNPER